MAVWLEARGRVAKQPVYVQTVAETLKIYKTPHRKVVTNVGI